MKKKIFLYLFVVILVILFLHAETIAKGIKNKIIKSDKVCVFLDQMSKKPCKYSVWMTPDEYNIFIDKIKNAKNYLEFGSGGSTFAALMNSNAQVVSVESDKKWHRHMRKWLFIRQNEGKRLVLYYVKVGKTCGGGYPLEPGKYKLFPNYSKNVFKAYPNNYDVVLIDGRFRIACALQTILNTNDDVVILWHDFPERTYYHDALKFLDIVQTVDKMVVLKKKKDINCEEVEQMYDEYKYDPR